VLAAVALLLAACAPTPAPTTPVETPPSSTPDTSRLGTVDSATEVASSGDPSGDLTPTATGAPFNSAQVLLTALSVEDEAPRDGYDRRRFAHWVDLDGTGCDARQQTLIDQALGPVQRDPFRCYVVEGDWYSIFDGVTHSGPSADVDVDHVVSLAEAWDSGAFRWSDEERRRFANDRRNLLAVTASSNRSKADQDAGTWRPARRDAWCVTATIMVTVKHAWALSVDAREYEGLREMLATCDDPASQLQPDNRLGEEPSTTSPPPDHPVRLDDCRDDQVALNHATAAELTRITQVGPARAAEIVARRPWHSVQQLVEIPGIGEKIVGQILAQDLACTG
jgi:hypothetical protein